MVTDNGLAELHNGQARGRPEVLLFCLLLLCYAYFVPRWADWNQNARFDLTLAMVEERSFSIDSYYANTGDYAVFRGRHYAGKAPGTSFLAVPSNMLFKGFLSLPGIRQQLQARAGNAAFQSTLREGGSGLQANKVEFAAGLYVSTLFTVGVPAALLWVLVFRFLRRYSQQVRWRLLAVLGLGLGTLAFPYASVLYGHVPSAFLLFTAFYLLVQIRREERSTHYLWLVGFLLGFAVITEFPTALGAGVLFCYAASSLRGRRGLAQIVAGALPPAMLLAFYNYACYGSPFTTGYRYLALFPQQAQSSLLGFSLPRWHALWGITFSSFRGLFFSSPFLLLTVPGCWFLWRRREWRAECVASICLVGAYVVLISGWDDWQGGFAVAGPRHLIPALPFMALPVLAAFEAARARIWLRRVVAALLALSLVVVFIQVAGGQDFAPAEVRNPLVDFFWPRFLAGDINRNLGMVLHLPRWYSLAPLVVAGTALLMGLLVGERRRSWIPARESIARN